MPAISPASADRSSAPGGGTNGPPLPPEALPPEPSPQDNSAIALSPTRSTRSPAGAFGLWLQAWRVALRRAGQSLAVPLRGSLFYSMTLSGIMSGRAPQRIIFHPTDSRIPHLEDANGMFRGRFHLAGHTLQLRPGQHLGSLFDSRAPSPAFTQSLHAFDWLRPLAAAENDMARDFALKLAKAWLKRNARYRLPAWKPEIIAARLATMFSHGDFFLGSADPVWRGKFFRCLRHQIRMLKRTQRESPDGVPRLQCAAALALGGFCLGYPRLARLGWKRLRAEIARQILADGGHVSRSPQALLESCRALSAVAEAATHACGQPPAGLDRVLERMADALRFLTLGDGTLGNFNGGNETDAGSLTSLMHPRAKSPLASDLPVSAYRRLAAARTLVVADTGAAPPSGFSGAAHAGCLAFEMSVAGQRLVVNCGTAIGMDAAWDRSLRSTPAHSTLTLGDHSQGDLLQGRLASLLGERAIGGPRQVVTCMGEGPHGWFIEASHDAYAERFGILHHRRMTLAPRGLSLTGADRLEPVAARLRKGGKATPMPFAIRFHIHPDLRMSLAQDGRSVILKFPHGEGWRFRWGGAGLAIEESIYLGSGAMRRAEQLVITDVVSDQPVECAWLFEQVG